MRYADVIVDNNTNATDELYTYACDFDEAVPGEKVIVGFGTANRRTEGYIARLFAERPEGVRRFKHIEELCPDVILSPEALRTALWMRNRYLCRYIEAVKCFLPGGEAKRKTKDPFEGIEPEEETEKTLTEAQQKALSQISASVEKKEHAVYLLHGVTGSGKTEVYIRAMEKVFAEGRQGIMLVPEISLTPQTVSRFMSRFGKESVAVLHSRLTPAQRAVEYKRIQSGAVKLVIGARSAVFAPFERIGIIILDEEHETSYKSDKSPKYDAVEVAVKRAMGSGAVVVLGSATPSVSDFYRSEKGLFRRLELGRRYNDTPLPAIDIVDMTAEARRGNRNLFSVKLVEMMKETLGSGRQVILFLNRRGYSSFVSCRECGHVVSCPECGIAMAYHKDEGACICHYCGRRTPLPRTCPKCGSSMIGRFGFGTQMVEEKAKELFPDASVERLDLDSVKRKGELEAVLKRFGKGKTDILIGTQLVAKGLDFSNVGLVGIISADVSLNIPDFRSSERTFQLVTQAAGRAGRGDEQGRVVIQSYSPEHPALTAALAHDYRRFYEREIGIRKAVAYPPFTDIFTAVISDEDRDIAEDSAQRAARWLRRKFEGDEEIRVLGPAPCTLVKESGMYRFQLLVKVPAEKRKEASLVFMGLRKAFTDGKNTAKLLTSDINPYSFI